MSKELERPISNFAATAVNYPLALAGTIVFLCLAAGVILSVAAKNWTLAGLSFGAFLGAVVLVYLNIRQSRKNAAGEKNEQLRWETALPDIQRQDLNIEITELGRILDVGSDQMGDLLSAYIVAEDLALRQIQHEEALPVLRHVSIGKTPFDGILIKQDLITCIAVTFLVSPQIRQEKIDSMLRKMTAVKKTVAEMKIGARLRFLLVLVTQLEAEDEARLRSSLGGQFSSTTVDIDIRMLDFEALQKTYALDPN